MRDNATTESRTRKEEQYKKVLIRSRQTRVRRQGTYKIQLIRSNIYLITNDACYVCICSLQKYDRRTKEVQVEEREMWEHIRASEMSEESSEEGTLVVHKPSYRSAGMWNVCECHTQVFYVLVAYSKRHTLPL